jgi:recombination protein RecA
VDRDKALDLALANIEKQFGKGSLMKLGDAAAVNIAAIPTGALSLDLALGIGGLPRGRVVEVYGPESSGKCHPAGTYVWTDDGLETIEELFARVDQPASCTSRVTDVSGYGVRLVNEEAQLETMAGVTHNHRKPVTRVVLDSGRHVEATANHPLRVLNERGRIVWRTVEELRTGDVLVSALFGAETATGGSDLTEDEAILLGYLLAEGSLGEKAKSRVVFSNRHDPDVTQEYLDLVEHVLGVPRQRVKSYTGDDDVIHDTALRRRLADDYGLAYCVSAAKEIPHAVRTGGAKIQRAFLSALYEGDGWIEQGPSVGLTTPSRTLAAQVQLLLYGLGIPATLRTRRHDEVDRDYHTVLVAPGAVHCFLEQVGFRSARRVEQVARHLDAAPGTTPASRPLTYERITAIEDAGIQPTFDVVVPGTHSFVANGILSHNTTVALHAVAEAQKGGGIAAFIDAEHALDPQYARALGVDINELLVSQPDTGEQALEIASMLIRSSAVDLIVIDSVAALTPKAEIEGDMGDSHVGLQARLMSQALRKIAGDLHRSDTAIIFINQLREKIGVMFGCASGQTRVTLADGSHETIGSIVKEKRSVEVLSYDAELGQIVPKRVTNWHDNGPTGSFLHFAVARAGGGAGHGESHIEFTPNHLIMTPAGWREAQELEVGDRVIQSTPAYLSPFQWEVLLGGLMGDGALSLSASGLSARFRMGHGVKQSAYADWKASLFANVNVSRTTNEKEAVFFHDVQPLPELAELRETVYIGGKKVLSHDYLKRLTPLSLAIWYQDDGTFQLRSKGLQQRTHGGSGRSEICVEAFERSSRERLREHLADTWGVEAKLAERGERRIPFLVFSRGETDKLQELIAPYVHPSMQYKLLPRYQNQLAVQPELGEARFVPMPMEIKRIDLRDAPRGDDHRYDLEVEGTHNYFADGIMVHNSPETTPGGRALKFYSSVRLDIRRIETLKDGTDAVGNRVRVKVVKNKVAPPFRQAEFDIIYGEGISKQGSLIDVGVEEGIIRKAGAWYTYDGEQLGQGKENARSFLKEHQDVALEIEKKIKEKLGLSPLAASESESDGLGDLDDAEG